MTDSTIIHGICRTNLDNYDCSRVTVFAALPRVGDSVVVDYKGSPTTLKIVDITHSQTREGYFYVGMPTGLKSGTPYIVVELNK